MAGGLAALVLDNLGVECEWTPELLYGAEKAWGTGFLIAPPPVDATEVDCVTDLWPAMLGKLSADAGRVARMRRVPRSGNRMPVVRDHSRIQGNPLVRPAEGRIVRSAGSPQERGSIWDMRMSKLTANRVTPGVDAMPRAKTLVDALGASCNRCLETGHTESGVRANQVSPATAAFAMPRVRKARFGYRNTVATVEAEKPIRRGRCRDVLRGTRGRGTDDSRAAKGDRYVATARLTISISVPHSRFSPEQSSRASDPLMWITAKAVALVPAKYDAETFSNIVATLCDEPDWDAVRKHLAWSDWPHDAYVDHLDTRFGVDPLDEAARQRHLPRRLPLGRVTHAPSEPDTNGVTAFDIETNTSRLLVYGGPDHPRCGAPPRKHGSLMSDEPTCPECLRLIARTAMSDEERSRESVAPVWPSADAPCAKLAFVPVTKVVPKARASR